MVDIEFGQTALSRKTRGSLGGIFAIPSEVKKIGSIQPTVALPKLDARREDLLGKHSQRHSKRHVDYMRQLMLMGVSFEEAHKRARRWVGN